MVNDLIQVTGGQVIVFPRWEDEQEFHVEWIPFGGPSRPLGKFSSREEMWEKIVLELGIKRPF